MSGGDVMLALAKGYGFVPSVDSARLVAWLEELGLDVTVDPKAPPCVVFAVGRIDHAGGQSEVTVFAPPASAIPEWVREEARDEIYLDEIDLLDLEDALDPSAHRVAAWLLGAFCSPSEFARASDEVRSMVDEHAVEEQAAQSGTGWLLPHRIDGTSTLGPVLQVVAFSISEPHDHPTGQDIAP